MKNVILLAPPAAGKGTVSRYLVEKYGYTHLSTGDVLRNAAKKDIELGKKINQFMKEGKFTSDDIILPLFKEEFTKRKDQRFILDGMPRKLNQAEYLENLFLQLQVDNYVVIYMDIERDSLSKRITNRRVCESCKASYNLYFEDFKSKVEGICDKCGGNLIQREDDTIEAFQTRYEEYLEEIEPLIHYYKEKGILYTVNANASNTEVLKQIICIIGSE